MNIQRKCSTYNGILFGHREKQNPVTHDNLDEPRGYHLKVREDEQTETNAVCCHFYMELKTEGSMVMPTGLAKWKNEGAMVPI